MVAKGSLARFVTQVHAPFVTFCLGLTVSLCETTK
jgi:hypothetical protein